MIEIARDSDRSSYVTLDGSKVREIVGPPSGTAANQSLAEAVVSPGGETTEHFHRRAEEIYRFVSGRGRLRVGDDQAEVAAGDTVAIPAGTTHKLWNPGPEPLVLLCMSAPPYSHDDTVLCEPGTVAPQPDHGVEET